MSHFSFPHIFFKRLVLQTHQKPVLVWKRVKRLLIQGHLTHSLTMTPFDTPGKQAF